ncbi:MAG: DUF1559 domain-containing protein [Gemmataceae bacterium]|nr:DUF1559 domain-containing protein [Gemmataceae bacterium]
MTHHLRRAFTLIELLVVIAIIAILIGLLLPAVQKVRDAANRSRCQNNLHQMAVAVFNYESDRGFLPPGVGPWPKLSSMATDRPTVQALILPYVEQASKYNQFNFDYDVHNDSINVPAQTQDIPIYMCPSDISEKRYFQAGRSNYFANIGATADLRSANRSVVGIFNFTEDAARNLTSKVRVGDISDGTSNTCMFGEVKRGTLAWNETGQYDSTTMMITSLTSMTDRTACTACNSPTGTFIRYTGHQYYRDLPATFMYSHTMVPNQGGGERSGFNQYDCGGPDYYTAHKAARSYHSGGVNVAMCDGSTRFVTDNVKPAVWRALGTRNGAEVLDGSEF